MADSKVASIFEAGTAVLKGVISAPLERVRRAASAARATRESARVPISAIIEGEIVPRLLMSHERGDARPGSRKCRPLTAEEAARIALLSLRLEAASLLDQVEALMAEGSSVESICLDLLAPAARMLGEMWDRDECDFIDVTMGLWRLQEVMREIVARSPAQRSRPDVPRSALFAPMPGNHHNFGALMLEEVFARAGWQCESLARPCRRELLDRLAQRPFDVVGLTLKRACPSAALANLIRAIRNASANPKIVVLVGGRMVNENPGLVQEVGADGAGVDALAALDLAESLVKVAPHSISSLR